MNMPFNPPSMTIRISAGNPGEEIPQGSALWQARQAASGLDTLLNSALTAEADLTDKLEAIAKPLGKPLTPNAKGTFTWSLSTLAEAVGPSLAWVVPMTKAKDSDSKAMTVKLRKALDRVNERLGLKIGKTPEERKADKAKADQARKQAREQAISEAVAEATTLHPAQLAHLVMSLLSQDSEESKLFRESLEANGYTITF